MCGEEGSINRVLCPCLLQCVCVGGVGEVGVGEVGVGEVGVGRSGWGGGNHRDNTSQVDVCMLAEAEHLLQALAAPAVRSVF